MTPLLILKNEFIDSIYTTLNLFYPNIKFTYEIENNSHLLFLDVLFLRNGTHLNATAYRKNTNNDQYIHWNALAPISWRRGTLRTLVNKA